MTGVYSDAADFVISDEGYRRFLKWEKLFTDFPIQGVPPNIAASRMTWTDGELAVRYKQGLTNGETRRDQHS